MKSLRESILDDAEDLIFKADEELISKFLKENYFVWGEYTIKKPSGNSKRYIVDVDGSVSFKNRTLESLTNGMFEFGEVSDNFYCDQPNSYSTKLKTLEGAPKIVYKTFDCSTCLKLVTLEGSPEYCGDFKCLHCRSLISLKGAPSNCDKFYCDDCDNLKTLEGAPKYVDEFSCCNCNHLKNLKGSPKTVSHRFDCVGCMNLISIAGCPRKCEIFSCRGAKGKFTEEEIQSICSAENIYV